MFVCGTHKNRSFGVKPLRQAKWKSLSGPMTTASNWSHQRPQHQIGVIDEGSNLNPNKTSKFQDLISPSRYMSHT